MTDAPENDPQGTARRPEGGDEVRQPLRSAQAHEEREETTEAGGHAARRRASLKKEIRAGWQRALGH